LRCRPRKNPRIYTALAVHRKRKELLKVSTPVLIGSKWEKKKKAELGTARRRGKKSRVIAHLVSKAGSEGGMRGVDCCSLLEWGYSGQSEKREHTRRSTNGRKMKQRLAREKSV